LNITEVEVLDLDAQSTYGENGCQATNEQETQSGLFWKYDFRFRTDKFFTVAYFVATSFTFFF